MKEQDSIEVKSCADLGPGRNCCFPCHEDGTFYQLELKDGTLCEVCCNVADRLNFEDRVK